MLRRFIPFFSPKDRPPKRTSTVVINATNIGSKPGGIAVYTLNLLRQLAQLDTRGIQFVVYVNKRCHPEFHDIEFPENFTLKWVTGAMAPESGFRGHLLRLLFANYLGWKHRREVLFGTSQLEVCFFHPHQVLMIHDVIPLLFKQFHHKQYYYFRYLIGYPLRRARAILTPSCHTEMLLKDVYEVEPQRIRVIPHGIPTKDHQFSGEPSPSESEEPYILYVGRLSPMKNIRILLKAFARLKDRLPHRLIIAGDDEGFLQKEVAAGKLSREELDNERIVWKNYVSNGEMLRLFQGASLFVYPSLYEGFGLPPLDAMACGCPVVASCAASLPEVCGDAARYVNPLDAEDVSETIYRVLTDEALRTNMIYRGYLRIARYCWRSSAEQHLEVLHTVLGTSEKGAAKPTSEADSTRSTTATNETRSFTSRRSSRSAIHP